MLYAVVLRARILFALLLMGSIAACETKKQTPDHVLFPRGTQPVLTGWEDDPARLSAAYCQSCHADSHADWSAGQHARSWSNPVFQEGYRTEPRMWCVHCHAPLQAQQDLVVAGEGGGLLDEGINCAACHVRDGVVQGTRARDLPEHRVAALPDFAAAQMCADCHQFNFPVFHYDEIHYTAEPMQNTYVEWQAAESTADCRTCHYDGHRLVGPHTPGELQRVFREFRAELEGELVHLSFQITERGHSLPTGDLFRSLCLELAGDPGFTDILFQRRWARFYGLGPFSHETIWNRALIKNTGLQPDENFVSITADAPSGPLFARLVYYLHDPTLGGRNSLARHKTEIEIHRLRVR